MISEALKQDNQQIDSITYQWCEDVYSTSVVQPRTMSSKKVSMQSTNSAVIGKKKKKIRQA